MILDLSSLEMAINYILRILLWLNIDWWWFNMTLSVFPFCRTHAFLWSNLFHALCWANSVFSLLQYMKIMGVHPIIHFLAWFVENMAMLTLTSAMLATILKTTGIFAHSNAFIIFLFILNFGVSVAMLSYFLSAFFNQANTAALCTSLIYMISFLPYIVLLILHNELSVVIQTFLVS